MLTIVDDYKKGKNQFCSAKAQERRDDEHNFRLFLSF